MEQSINAFRWISFVCLSTASLVISYADRTNIAVVIIPMSDQYNWDERTRGLVLGAFFLGYSCTQILGGWLSDHLVGGGLVLAVGVFLWSLFTLLTPVSAHGLGVKGVLAVRVLMGASEGVGYPAVHSMVQSRIPTDYLNVMVAGLNCAGYVGGVIALLASAPIVSKLGWPAVFYVFGATGMIWMIPWIYYLTQLDYSLNTSELAHRKHIEDDVEERLLSPTGKRRRIQNVAESKKVKALSSPLSTAPTTGWCLLKNKAVWAMLCCYYCNAWGFWLILSWLPSFLQQQYRVSIDKLGLVSVLPYTLQGIVAMIAGTTCDRLLSSRRTSKRTFRLTVQGIAMLGPAIALLLLLLKGLPQWMVIGLISTAMALNALSTVGVGMNHFDLAPKRVGFLYGILNTVGVLPGVIGVPLTGLMLQMSNNQWAPVFGLAALHYVFGYIIWLLFGSFAPI